MPHGAPSADWFAGEDGASSPPLADSGRCGVSCHVLLPGPGIHCHGCRRAVLCLQVTQLALSLHLDTASWGVWGEVFCVSLEFTLRCLKRSTASLRRGAPTTGTLLLHTHQQGSPWLSCPLCLQTLGAPRGQ